MAITRAQEKQQVSTGGRVMKKNLKPVSSKNKGLKKLPTNVRNKMGYMKKGGKVQ